MHLFHLENILADLHLPYPQLLRRKDLHRVSRGAIMPTGQSRIAGDLLPGFAIRQLDDEKPATFEFVGDHAGRRFGICWEAGAGESPNWLRRGWAAP